MEGKDWLVSERAISKSKKQYAHFDLRIDISKQATYISDPHNIAKHGFYPLIHYKKDMTKFNKVYGKTPKQRDICYAAHIDRCIYQYYSFLLNEQYNQRIEQEGLSLVAVAYRTDLHKTNIHFAKQAIDFIRSNSPCYVMIGDFTGFFDNLDHKYLKRQWCSLLSVSRLPEDHYAIFKNITKYSIWELSDLLKINGLKDTDSGRRTLNSKLRVITKDQYNKNRSHIKKNPNPYGIPQGSPISALLANIYMLDIDKQVNDVVVSMHGMYMRYSDDFIIILPAVEEVTAKRKLTDIITMLNETPGLTLEPSKTQYFFYHDHSLCNCGSAFHANADCKNRFINFLGFTFDGKNVSLRAKTVSKYYYRMYRKAKTIAANGGYTTEGKRISCKNLYTLYSKKGAQKKRRNFFTYVESAKNVFGPDELIDKDTKRHMQKIRNALKRSRCALSHQNKAVSNS